MSKGRLFSRKDVFSAWICGVWGPQTGYPLQCRTGFEVGKEVELGACVPLPRVYPELIFKMLVSKILQCSRSGMNPVLGKTLDRRRSQEE